MMVAEKLERLARFLPGVAGYQDRERSRDTDKAVRLRLADALSQLKHEIEAEQERRANTHKLEGLDELGRLGAKLDRLRNEVTYAARGYRSFFDSRKLTQEMLEQLYDFDLNLFAATDSLHAAVRALSTAGDQEAASSAARTVDQQIDHFGRTFADRCEILSAG